MNRAKILLIQYKISPFVFCILDDDVLTIDVGGA